MMVVVLVVVLMQCEIVCIHIEEHRHLLSRCITFVISFAFSGKLLHTFGSKDRNSPQHLDCPHYITSDRSNHLIISDYVNHVVKVFTLEGDLIRTIGGKGSQDGQLYFPTGVTTDQIDNIIIVDNGNHRVSMFSPEGEFLEHLLCDQDGVQWPEAVALSEDDMMAITEYTLDTDAVKTFHLNF